MPYALTFTDKAKDTIADAYEWLAGFSEDAAARFVVRVPELLEELCEDLASGTPPRFDSDASIFFSRRAFLFLLRTGEGRARSSSGAWRVFYELLDTDGDGQADTVQVLGIYHAASRPLLERLTEGEE
jgi:plasmid stabilization system protein ParE